VPNRSLHLPENSLFHWLEKVKPNIIIQIKHRTSSDLIQLRSERLPSCKNSNILLIIKSKFSVLRVIIYISTWLYYIIVELSKSVSCPPQHDNIIRGLFLFEEKRKRKRGWCMRNHIHDALPTTPPKLILLMITTFDNCILDAHYQWWKK